MTSNIIGKRLKEIRLSKHMQQKDVVSYLNIAKSTYSQYESGKRKPSNDILVELAKFYDVPIDYLLGNDQVSESKAEYMSKDEAKRRINEMKEKYGLDMIEFLDEDLETFTEDDLEDLKKSIMMLIDMYKHKHKKST